MISVSFGSSPHGRGTRHEYRRINQARRFIPARAGNTNPNTRCDRRQTVHPRTGGEHCGSTISHSAYRGSSPHGRGTLEFDELAACLLRFIPRTGGEHGITRPVSTRWVGSSPHGRGTPSHSDDPRATPRFIPARAGNTSFPRSPFPAYPVHPRTGGEHPFVENGMIWDGGSSPHGRGTLLALVLELIAIRFIPARAGNTA